VTEIAMKAIRAESIFIRLARVHLK